MFRNNTTGHSDGAEMLTTFAASILLWTESAVLSLCSFSRKQTKKEAKNTKLYYSLSTHNWDAFIDSIHSAITKLKITLNDG